MLKKNNKINLSKKIFLNIMLIVMIMITFVGCSNVKGTSNENNKESTEELNKETKVNEETSSDLVGDVVELNIFAAASLTDSLNSIKELYEEQNPNIKIILNFASSGALEKQIEQGAPADIFFSASKAKVNALVEGEEIDKIDIAEILENSMVVVCSKDVKKLPTSLEDLKDKSFVKVSIAAPESAPAGRYAVESLKKNGVFDEISEKIVYGKTVRQTLTYIETDEVEAAIVYSSDAVIMKNGVLAFEIPKELHSQIVYPAAILKTSTNRELAQNLIGFLQNEESSKIFIQNGFKIKED